MIPAVLALASHPRSGHGLLPFHVTQQEGSFITLAVLIVAFLVARALWKRARASRPQQRRAARY